MPSIDRHPLPRLIDAGLTVTINSDTPAIFSAPIASEYELAKKTFGLNDEAMAELARASVTASFAGESAKSSIQSEISRWLEESR